jgi:hypothetical protein
MSLARKKAPSSRNEAGNAMTKSPTLAFIGVNGNKLRRKGLGIAGWLPSGSVMARL